MTIRNFKRFDEVEIELGQAVVLIGPNNSGKSTALQALALWQHGVRRWYDKRGDKEVPKQRPGVTLNRRDLIALPVPEANLLWRDLHVREASRENGEHKTRNIRFEIDIYGLSEGAEWRCGLEFDYANEESFYCRPLLLPDADSRMPVPPAAAESKVAFLPPMSGLGAIETRLTWGAIQVRIGEGRTAEVLRNLCWLIYDGDQPGWKAITEQMHQLFGVTLLEPQYIEARGEITLRYKEPSGTRLDISSAGRGLQQTLLLLAYLQANRGAVLLLDEPDAHLEILRQRQIYQMLTDAARQHGNQIIAASHSEVLLNEAADRDMVVAFVGRPHRIDDRGHQLLKSLREIGFEHYAQAEQTGWVLYLEGATDLAILRAFAELRAHPAAACLERPFVHYVANQPRKAEEHFFGLREAKRDLVGLAIYDRLNRELPENPFLRQRMWRRREIENYLCQPETLEAYALSLARETAGGPLFTFAQEELCLDVMRNVIGRVVPPIALEDRSDRWWTETKVSDEFLDRVFALYFEHLNLSNIMHKSDYHQLARFVPAELLAPEIDEMLDLIVATAEAAKPRA